MKSILYHFFRPALCYCLLLVSLPVLSMSQNPEEEIVPLKDTRTDMHGEQFENRNPEEDARAAIDAGDLRLLGFATRVTSVPGVAATDRQAAMDACGVRLLEGFGDVIRSKEELLARRQASKYAVKYNRVILEQCLKKD